MGTHAATMRVRAGVRSSPLLLHAGTPPTAAAAESGMRTLVTGSSGHLGEALVRTLRARGADVVSLDSRPSRYTNIVGCVSDRALLRDVMAGVEVVFHAAAHHKPQLAFEPPR